MFKDKNMLLFPNKILTSFALSNCLFRSSTCCFSVLNVACLKNDEVDVKKQIFWNEIFYFQF